MIGNDMRAEALRGPWEAVLTETAGWVMTLDDFEEPGDARISIVRRTAAPGGPDADGDQRLPGTYNSDDHLIEFCDFEEFDEVEARWVQAQAMVEGLNAAARSGMSQ